MRSFRGGTSLKKSNTGILIGVLAVIVALIAVFSFTSSCAGSTKIDNSIFEQAIGIVRTEKVIGQDSEGNPITEVVTTTTGKADAMIILRSDKTLKAQLDRIDATSAKINEVQFSNYNIYIAVTYRLSGGAADIVELEGGDLADALLVVADDFAQQGVMHNRMTLTVEVAEDDAESSDAGKE